MSNADIIAQRLNELTAFIEEAQIKLHDGEVLDLSHLDSEVAGLCNQALSLPPAQAQELQPAMATMISKLEALSLALQDFQSHLKGQS